jgi:FMN phosphatase YigB (HAD superfamily)
VSRYSLIPHECVFLDDHLSFLKPAKKLGMSTILVHQNTDLKEEFKKMDIFL